MSLRCGIVGLPNVGKSTLFNALSDAGADSANYPFCTIEPNVGVVPLPDDRLEKLADLAGSNEVIPASVEFVDIAGLVEGASQGEGLGNQFLAHIREVDAIVHVVRCFENPNVTHVAGSVNPERDIGIIDTELALKDLDTVTKAVERAENAAKTRDKDALAELDFYQRLEEHLGEGEPARTFPVEDSEKGWMRNLFLLTDKPVLYAANVGEEELPDGNEYVDAVRKIADREEADVVVVSAELEAQIAELAPDERELFLQDMGLDEPGLHRLVRAAFKLLGLLTFFTVGPKEARAWTIEEGTRAPAAGGTIHSDFERGFIRAETITFQEFEKHGSEAGARDAGALRKEGKDYVVQDGDVILFRFNV